MSGTFDEGGTGSDSTGKRPVPTIEGTATEVSVEPGAEESQDERSAAAEQDVTPEGDVETREVSRTDGDSHVDDGEPRDADADPVETKPVDNRGAGDQSFGSRVLAWFAALFTHALAGLAGGLAVLAALSWGYLPIGDLQEQSALNDIETRIAALEAAPKTAENAAALDGLKSRLATLESEAKDENTSAVDPREVKALSTQVAELETRLKSMAEATNDGGSVSDAAAINQQVAEVEQRLDKKIQSKIESEVRAAMTRGGAGSADIGSINALKTEVSDLNAKLKALTAATMDGNEGSSLKPEVSALQRRLNEIEATLPSLLDEVDEANAQTRKANSAIAVSALRDSVNSGRPYATELTTVSALSDGAEQLKALAEHENTGIPTVPMLASSFATLLEKARSAETGDEPDLVSRLLGSAQSLVKVRRIDEQAEGSGPTAILARAQAQLEAGNLREAVLQVEALEGPLAQLFGPWIDDALARLDANTALQQLQEALLVSLANSDGVAEKADTATQDEEIE
jgi:predicted  nucleic acid-binding Zn-ribbon protein